MAVVFNMALFVCVFFQYKDAFMKANPDYKWHSTDRLPQPAKMATRPTNVRPARSLSTSECSAGDQSSGEWKHPSVCPLV